jgi:hypothetical protein
VEHAAEMVMPGGLVLVGCRGRGVQFKPRPPPPLTQKRAPPSPVKFTIIHNLVLFLFCFYLTKKQIDPSRRQEANNNYRVKIIIIVFL